MLVCAEGQRIGSDRAGCLEADAAEHARCVHETGEPHYIVYDPNGPNGDLFLETGCHGRIGVLVEPMRTAAIALDILDDCVRHRRWTTMATVYEGEDSIATHFVVDEQYESPSQGVHLPQPLLQSGVFVEQIAPPIALIVCGAGRDAHPVVRMATMLGWQVTVVDRRRDLLDNRAFTGAAVVSCAAECADRNVALDRMSAVVIVTHNYLSDLELLRQLLPSDAGYVGLVGSRRRADRLRGDLLDEGIEISRNQWKRFHAAIRN